MTGKKKGAVKVGLLAGAGVLILVLIFVLPNPKLNNDVSSTLAEERCMQDSIVGRYRHYKGNEYEVIGVCHHSETLEKLVVYKALYISKDFGADSLWVRPYDMFFQDVTIDGQTGPRFEKLT